MRPLVVAIPRTPLSGPSAFEQRPSLGASALGHPLGASGARLAGAAALELQLTKAKRALATMCIGVGLGVSLALAAV